MGQESVTTNVNSLKWQGYRGGDKSIVVYYESDSNSELPLRKIPEEGAKKHISADPNYETLTYGLYDCGKSKMRNTFVKRKYGYVFFMTRYEGTDEKLEGKVMITGYYKVDRTADVQKLHLRQLESSSCMSDRICQALRAVEAVFVSTEDAYILTAASLKSLGYEKKVTRMTKIDLDEEQTKKVIKKFAGKENIISKYVEETLDLLPEEADE
jgi:hypothetical protein